jgi:hypothetical protein
MAEGSGLPRMKPTGPLSRLFFRRISRRDVKTLALDCFTMDDQLTTPDDFAVDHQHRSWNRFGVRFQFAGIVDLLDWGQRRFPSYAIVVVHFLAEIIQEPTILVEDIPRKISSLPDPFRAVC